MNKTMTVTVVQVSWVRPGYSFNNCWEARDASGRAVAFGYQQDDGVVWDVASSVTNSEAVIAAIHAAVDASYESQAVAA